MATTDPALDTFVEGAAPVEPVDTTAYAAAADPTFDSADALLNEVLVPTATTTKPAASGPNWALIGGGIGAGVVLLGLGVAGYMYVSKK